MPDVKAPNNGKLGPHAIAAWIMAALLAVVLGLGSTILQGNAVRLDRVEAAVMDRGERLAGVESRLGAIERTMNEVSVKLDDLRMRR